MSGSLWPGGFDRWADWETAPKVWLLLASPFWYDQDQDTIADVSATEVTVAGYARQPLGEPHHEFWTDDEYVLESLYGANPPWWTGLAAGQLISALALALDGPDDASSGLILWWPINQATDSGQIYVNFPEWTRGGDPLPGGEFTEMIHTSISWVNT